MGAAFVLKTKYDTQYLLIIHTKYNYFVLTPRKKAIILCLFVCSLKDKI